MSLMDNLKSQTKNLVSNAAQSAKNAAENAMNNAAEERRQKKEAENAAKEAAKERKDAQKKFKPRQKFDKYIAFDDQIQAFEIGKDFFFYRELLGAELYEDGSSVTQGGLGGSIVGAAVTGNIFGAMLGGSVSKKKTKGVCENLSIMLSLNSPTHSNITIPFITYSVKTDSIVYKQTIKTARECIAKLQAIVSMNQSNQAAQATVPVQAAYSAADEIAKFKDLCDQGIITQEEFDAKRKQLLGL